MVVRRRTESFGVERSNGSESHAPAHVFDEDSLRARRALYDSVRTARDGVLQRLPQVMERLDGLLRPISGPVV
jgi:hypothetical protein